MPNDIDWERASIGCRSALLVDILKLDTTVLGAEELSLEARLHTIIDEISVGGAEELSRIVHALLPVIHSEDLTSKPTKRPRIATSNCIGGEVISKPASSAIVRTVVAAISLSAHGAQLLSALVSGFSSERLREEVVEGLVDATEVSCSL